MKNSSNSILYIGHASILIQIFGKRILVDPVFEQKLFGLFPRKQQIGISPENLGQIDAVLITHIHSDHLDTNAFKYFSLSTPVIIPKNTEGFVKKFIYQKLETISDKERISLDDIIISASKSKHRSGRFLSIRNAQTLNYVIEANNQCLFLGGDSGYGSHYKEIGEKFNIDIALIPIGHTGLHLNTKRNFLTPKDAALAIQDLNCKKFIPISWGSYPLPWKNSRNYLEEFKKEINLLELDHKMIVLHPGETFDF